MDVDIAAAISLSQLKDYLELKYPATEYVLWQFLILISATLVMSIAFSEKIIDFQKSQGLQRKIVFVTWTLFVLALVSCGCGLYLTYLTAEAAMAAPTNLALMARVRSLGWTSYLAQDLAGLLYLSGLNLWRRSRLTVILIAGLFLTIVLPLHSLNDRLHSRPAVILVAGLILTVIRQSFNWMESTLPQETEKALRAFLRGERSETSSFHLTEVCRQVFVHAFGSRAFSVQRFKRIFVVGAAAFIPAWLSVAILPGDAVEAYLPLPVHPLAVFPLVSSLIVWHFSTWISGLTLTCASKHSGHSGVLRWLLLTVGELMLLCGIVSAIGLISLFVGITAYEGTPPALFAGGSIWKEVSDLIQVMLEIPRLTVYAGEFLIGSVFYLFVYPVGIAWLLAGWFSVSASIVRLFMRWGGIEELRRPLSTIGTVAAVFPASAFVINCARLSVWTYVNI